MPYLRSFLSNLYKAAKAWSADNITLHSASLAYYSVFSVAPLLLIAIAIAGFFLGEQASKGQIFGEIQGLIGIGGAQAVQTMIENASDKRNIGAFATLLSIITLLVGATGMFQQLQQSLNMIWRIESPKDNGLISWLRRRIFTFAMIGVISFLLLISLIASTLISAAIKYFGTSPVWQILNFLASIGAATFLFASVYRFLPDTKVKWRNLWVGSFLTAILFSIGKWLIGFYIAHSSASSAYGAAGSLVVLLMWVYYSAMILYFGAEFIKVSVLRKE